MAVNAKGRTILFVCSGNTCRSPMAAGIFNARFAGTGDTAISAGLHASIGRRPTEHAVGAAAELGADISAHRSTPMTDALAFKATEIVAMTREIARELKALYPFAAKKVKVLGTSKEKPGTSFDIPDPYGGSLKDYRLCAALIAACLTATGANS
jgi:protein-tyrosine phosphatase